MSELARLWDAEMPDYVRTFLALMIGTASRPVALLELTRFQCHIERGVIDLNPPGRKQTKKRRPKIPMAAWLVPFIESADGHVVSWRGRPVTKIAGAFQTMRDSAGFGFDVPAYTVRHTVATELAGRGVPYEQISALLGQRMPNMRTTERYIHVMPEHLSSARKALNDLANDIGRLAGRPRLPTNLRASSVLVTSRQDCSPAWKPTETGAAIATRDDNVLWGKGLRRPSISRGRAPLQTGW
jgi:integrase